MGNAELVEQQETQTNQEDNVLNVMNIIVGEEEKTKAILRKGNEMKYASKTWYFFRWFESLFRNQCPAHDNKSGLCCTKSFIHFGKHNN